jgi:probable rRNA maturation factor
MAIRFFTEDVDEVKIPKLKISSWIKECCLHYKHQAGNINYIFCSDEYLREINIQYLRHNYYTDIITFNYNEKNDISGDIYISTDRVSDNAAFYKVDFLDELLRVIIHGILHLNGFNDDNENRKTEMRVLENFWIENFKKSL